MKQLFATLSALALLGAGAVAQDSPAVQPNTPPLNRKARRKQK